jgi:hypothetical protein
MTADTTRTVLLREFTRLRHGYGIQDTNLRRRLGPELARRCDVPQGAGDREIRERVVAAVHEFSRELPEAERRTIDVALGAERGVRFPSLGDRIAHLMAEWSCSLRTARRRIDRAFELLVDEMLAESATVRTEPADPAKGWQVKTFEALMRLDTPTPELIEKRTIVATRDGVRTIVARLSLPRTVDGQPDDADLDADVQQGARIVRRDRQGEGHFRYLLELPTTLNRTDEHSYTMIFRIPPGQPMRTHYAFVPLVDCEWFRVRVRFDTSRPPRVVWRLNGLPPRVMSDRLTPGPPLRLDGAGEVELEFRDMDRGYGYGLAWLPGDSPF